MTAPDATSVATNLTGNVGNQVIDTAVALAPVAVPFVLAMTAIAWVLRKFGLNRSAALTPGGGYHDSFDTKDSHAARLAYYKQHGRVMDR